MLYATLKVLITAVLVVSISEVSKRSSLLGGLLASLPIVSLFAILWLWIDTGDRVKIADLSWSVFWLVLPSLPFFVVLPVLLRRQMAFWPALGIALASMLALYGLMLLGLRVAGVKL